MREVGAEGEAAFQARAIREGLKVCRSFQEGLDYDFIVDNGPRCWKVQVKATETLVGKTSYHVASGYGKRRRKAYSAEQLDFLIVYVIPEDTWFIVPIEVIAGRLTMAVPSKYRENLGPMGQWLGRWDLLLYGKWRERPSGKPTKGDLSLARWGRGKTGRLKYGSRK